MTGTLTLPYADRHRRRIQLQDDGGEPFLLALPHAVRLNDGGGLKLDTGEFIEVRAAIEAVTDIVCQSVVHTAQVAWHVGNRHAPVQVLPDSRLRILSDHVLHDMLIGLGADLTETQAPFVPEGGAYASGKAMAHSHD